MFSYIQDVLAMLVCRLSYLFLILMLDLEATVSSLGLSLSPDRLISVSKSHSPDYSSTFIFSQRQLKFDAKPLGFCALGMRVRHIVRQVATVMAVAIADLPWVGLYTRLSLTLRVGRGGMLYSASEGIMTIFRDNG